MARQKAFDRQQAVEKVMLIIWREGLEGATVKSLSENLGITRSSFYNAFGNIETLFKEVISAYAQFTPLQRLITLQQGEPVLPAITETLANLCAMRAQDNQHRGCLAMNALAQIADSQSDMACHMSQQLNLSNARVEQILEWAKDGGEIPEHTDTQALALAVTNLFIGLNVMSKAIHEEERLWLAAKTTLQGLGLYREH